MKGYFRFACNPIERNDRQLMRSDWSSEVKREFYRAHRVRGPGESGSGSGSSDGSERGHALLAGCHERRETAPTYGNSGHVSSDAQPKADPSDSEFRYRMGAFQNLGDRRTQDGLE